jgi:hypothetical protein
MRRCVEVYELNPPQSRLSRLFGQHPLRDDARAWYRGALGERAVARHLALMGTEWHSIHGIPVGTKGSDIDHLVVGPAGVFSINAKRHFGARVFAGGGSVRVNGQPTQYVRNSQHEAQRVNKLLSVAVGYNVEVTPMLVIVDAREVTYGKKKSVVPVMSLFRMARWLRRKPATLSPQQIAELSDAASRLSTWRSQLPSGLADLEVQERFAQIDQKVRTAILRTRLWLVGVAGVSLIIAWEVINFSATSLLSHF